MPARIAPPKMAPPTPEERALGWTIELITTTPALGADAKLKIMAALGPQLVGYALPDHIKARIILDALNLHTRHFTHVDAENAELVFESLITVGDVAQAEATRVGGFELPQPPMFLTAMSYCETVVSALREPGAPDIEAFHEKCVSRVSPNPGRLRLFAYTRTRREHYLCPDCSDRLL